MRGEDGGGEEVAPEFGEGGEEGDGVGIDDDGEGVELDGAEGEGGGLGGEAEAGPDDECVGAGGLAVELFDGGGEVDAVVGFGEGNAGRGGAERE